MAYVQGATESRLPNSTEPAYGDGGPHLQNLSTLNSSKHEGERGGLVDALENIDPQSPSKDITDDAGVTKLVEATRLEGHSTSQKDGLGSRAPFQDKHGLFEHERAMVARYLHDNVPEFRELAKMRLEVLENSESDQFFEQQRVYNDHPSAKTGQIFFSTMSKVAEKLQDAMDVFSLTGKRPTMLALGCAPGGFVNKALSTNAQTRVVGISLPEKDKGVSFMVKNARLELIEADVTMLAADLGVDASEIPRDHPDAGSFLGRKIRPRAQFDLVTCEAAVMRKHIVAPYRDGREMQRLSWAQLALGLARVRPGGTMVVLMHKPDEWYSLCILYRIAGFSRLRLFKPDLQHQHQSNFYLIATDVQSQSEAARHAVGQWTAEWRAATFGSDDELIAVLHRHALNVGLVLREFGEEWVKASREVWALQAEGLKRKFSARDGSKKVLFSV